MSQKPLSRRILLPLVAGLLILPVAAWAIVAMGALLNAMGDAEGQVFANRLAWGCGVLWVLDLVCLVVIQAIHALGETDHTEQ
jgi:hypothetical protein